MSRKRKVIPKKRARRSAYERALQDATARLDKAMAEQIRHQEALESLAKEIPYLQGIIRALEPEDDRLAATLHARGEHQSVGGRTIKSVLPTKVADQADFLAKFVKPLETNVMRAAAPVVVADPENEEAFLPPAGGEEILP